MAATMKTPGVYIVEKNAFPNSVVEVETAVPAFIGYTETAVIKGTPLKNKPYKIGSMAEFELYFGGPYTPVFQIVEAPAATQGQPPPPEPDFLAIAPGSTSTQPDHPYAVQQTVHSQRMLYWCMQHFFQNGGGPCYIVSVGSYVDPADGTTPIQPNFDDLNTGIDALTRENEPTMLVIPDAMLLSESDCISLQQQMLSHCGEVMLNRVAILDIWGGFAPQGGGGDGPVDNFRNHLGVNNLMFGAAYYPWVQTTIMQDRDVTYRSFQDDGSAVKFSDLIKANMSLQDQTKYATLLADIVKSDDDLKTDAEGDWGKLKPPGDDANKAAWLDASVATRKAQINSALLSASDLYGNIATQAAKHVNLLPPAAAMAGVYTMVDNTRGVWKAPANVSLNSVTKPSVNISKDEQADLNVTPQGKSINAIRSFIGEGVLVWGARTLDGNSLDWRYINVRRTMIMLEESCKLASKAMVFEPNVAGTWTTIKSMISNFLTSVWKRGGLAGAVPDDAFSVFCGLGETMTADDILEGILRVTVLVAVSRPAEFIEITFQQQMQKS